jgi:hypothetical protein
MKKFLLPLAIFLTMSCAGQSITTDTLCFPVSVIKKVLIAAEQKKVLDSQVIILNERIANFQLVIATLNAKDSATVAKYEAEIKVMKDQRVVFEEQIKNYDKLLKREKRKRILTTVGGVLSTCLGLFLYLSK